VVRTEKYSTKYFKTKSAYFTASTLHYFFYEMRWNAVNLAEFFKKPIWADLGPGKCKFNTLSLQTTKT